MISGARDEAGSSMPGSTTSPVMMVRLLLAASRLVEFVVCTALVAVHDPGATGDAALPDEYTSTISPVPFVLSHIPLVSPAIVPETKFHPAVTAIST